MPSKVKLLVRIVSTLIAVPLCCGIASAQSPAMSPLDIVGIHPGMTPKEVRAALTAYNPNLAIMELTTRLMDPTVSGKYERVPRYLVARTVNRAQPDSDLLPDGSAEAITVEFLLPPNVLVADRISRWVQFPRGKPVLVRTLLEAAEKKYGPSNGEAGNDKGWAFGADGKLIMTAVPHTARICWPQLNAFPMFRSGNDGREDAGQFSLQESTPPSPYDPKDFSAGCGDYQFVNSPNLGIGLDKPLYEFTVFLESGPLYAKGVVNTHQWLQDIAAGRIKKQANDDAARAAPKL